MPAPKDPVAYELWRVRVAEGVKKSRAARPKPDWEARIASWRTNAPLCACGCGQQVAVNKKWARISNLRVYPYRPFLPGHNNRRTEIVQILTSREEQVALGTVLGDGHLGLPHARASGPRLICNHGLKQKSYADWKAVELARLGSKVTVEPNPGYGETWARLATSVQPALNPLRKAFYDAGKRVTKEVLDRLAPLGLAVWFMDDGTGSGAGAGLNGMTLHTQGFVEEDCWLIAGWFKGRGFQNEFVTVDKGHGVLIRFNQDAALRLRTLIEPHVIPEMRYKLWLA
jgi:hypothetical protein